MENLDPSSVETQQTVVSEIFRSAAADEKSLTLGLLLKAYDVTIAKHGITATDLLGIQIYRSLLQWGRCHTAPRPREPLAPLQPDRSLAHQGDVLWIKPVRIPDVQPLVERQHQQLLQAAWTSFKQHWERRLTKQHHVLKSTKTWLKKMLEAWIVEVRKTHEVLRDEHFQRKLRSINSWKAAVARRRSLRECRLKVVNLRRHQTMAWAIRHWLSRCSTAEPHHDLREPVESMRDFDVLLASVAYGRRCCRRAMNAWQLAVQWEALASRLHRSSGLRLQSAVFQVWVDQWHQDRKEAALLRRAEHFSRRQRLEAGVDAFRWNVVLSARARTLQEAQSRLEESLRFRQRQTLEDCWSAMLRYSKQRKLMKLYRKGADLHYVRTRLGRAWQAWHSWYRKRGKVWPRNLPQKLLAARTISL